MSQRNRAESFIVPGRVDVNVDQDMRRLFGFDRDSVTRIEHSRLFELRREVADRRLTAADTKFFKVIRAKALKAIEDTLAMASPSADLALT